MRVLLLLCLLLVGTEACQNLPPCVTPALREVRLRWGEQDSTGSSIRGYELTARAELFRYEAAGDSLLRREPLGKLDGQLYCRLLAQAHHAFLTAQAFHVPAPLQRFVEYSAPAARMRAVWNPQYRTHGNDLFWQLYDSLESARSRLLQ